MRPPEAARAASRRATYARAERGGVSRPSVKTCTAIRGTARRRASSSRANRCRSCEWTPPSETRPIRCSVAPGREASSQAATSAGFSKKDPSRMARSTRSRSWGTIRPAPRFRCPTSELPISPAGRPTASPEASSSVHGSSAIHRSNTGLRARVMALPSEGGAHPHPSLIRRTTGRLFKREPPRWRKPSPSPGGRRGARDPRRRAGTPCRPRRVTRRRRAPPFGDRPRRSAIASKWSEPVRRRKSSRSPRGG